MTSKPELVERLRAWSYRRQLLDSRKASPIEALRGVVGVYSTHPTAPLALWARAEFSPGAFADLERERQMVRVHAMRGSGFLLPVDTAAVVFAATHTPTEKLASRLRNANVDAATYARLVPRVLKCCATPVTPGELRACLPVAEDVYMVARILTREGKMLRVGSSLRTDQLRYVATSAWLGQPFEEVPAPTALAWLAREYLRAYGPARLADFAWWAGATRKAAATALGEVQSVEREGLLLLEEDVAAFEGVEPLEPGCVALLPKWDSYTMGYAPDGRQRFVDDRHLKLAYTSASGSPGATAGDGLPLILVDGCAVASWSHRFSGSHMLVTIQPFEPDADLPDTGQAFAELGALLSAVSVDVTTEDRVRP